MVYEFVKYWNWLVEDQERTKCPFFFFKSFFPPAKDLSWQRHMKLLEHRVM